MFDNVGKNPDKEATKRQLVALLLTVFVGTFVSGSVGLYLIIMAFLYVTDQIAPKVEDDATVVEVQDPAMDEPPPPPPPPPPPAASEPQDDVKPDPEEPSEDIKKLDEKPPEEVKADVPSGGQDGGVVGGEVGGVVGGVVGGEVGGVLGGQLGGVRTFHHSEVEVKKRVMPEYPDAAKAMNLGDVDCKVRIFIDEDGVPFDVKFEACPKVFQDSASEAIMKWRWYPAKVAGEKVKAQFVLNITYKLT